MSSPKPKRPKNKGHHSSFLERFHRYHDARNHPWRVRQAEEEAAPLLQEAHPDLESVSNAEEALAGNLQSAYTTEPEPIIQNTARRVSTFVLATSDVVTETTKDALSKAGPFFKRNSERILAGLCILLAIVAFGEAIDILRHRPVPTSNICTTPACISAASKILDNLHPSVVGDVFTQSQSIDPCEDFEEYVCGGFKLNHVLREDQGDMSTDTIMAEEVQASLRKILEQSGSTINSADNEIFTKVKDAYVACTDQGMLREFGIKPLRTITNEIRMLFSGQQVSLSKSSSFKFMSGTRAKTNISLTTVFKHMMHMGINTLVKFEIEADDKSPEVQSIFASPVRPVGLPVKELYNNQKITTDYQHIIASTLEHFYDVPDNKSMVIGKLSGFRYTVSDLAQGVLDLETKIATILPNEEDIADTTKSYHRMTYKQFESLIPQLSIADIANDWSPDSYNGNTVIVTATEYLQKLSSILSATPIEVVQAFLVWKAIQEHAERVQHESMIEWTQFSNQLAGKDPFAKSEQWRKCVDSVNADFGWILSKFYIQDLFSDHSRGLAGGIVADIQKAFVGLLADAEWMSNDDLDRAVKKAMAITIKIGYPDKHPNVSDPASLQGYYSTVVVNNNTYFENKLSAVQGDLFREWSRLGSPTDSDEWAMSATTVNAYYDRSSNEIVFPAAMLRSPLLYDSSLPKYLSYSAFGAVAGREISHAFDSQGSRYDESGTYRIWWSNLTRQAFESKLSCFANQYSQYTVHVPDGIIQVNGDLTLDENVDDTGGVHAAYQAWSAKEASERSQLLPGLEQFNNKQLFWLSYGSQLCSKTTKQAALQRILSDPHSPNPIRIKGTVANSRDFRDAFNCPSKTPTCELW